MREELYSIILNSYFILFVSPHDLERCIRHFVDNLFGPDFTVLRVFEALLDAGQTLGVFLDRIWLVLAVR
jgi:hypothetical protein